MKNLGHVPEPQTVEGVEYLTIPDYANLCGLTLAAISSRMSSGWPVTTIFNRRVIPLRAWYARENKPARFLLSSAFPSIDFEAV